MKLSVLFFVLLCLTFQIFAQNKPTLAVMRLDSKNIPEDKLEVLSNRLQSELYQTEKFILLERMKIKEVIEELGFQQAGYIDVNRALEIGNMLGAKKIMFGNIDKVENIYTVDVRLIDIMTSRIDNIAKKDFSPYSDFDFVLSYGMEYIARILTNLSIEKNYDKIALQEFESKNDPGFRFSFGLSINKNADGSNHINNSGFMKNLIGLSMGLEASHEGFGGFGGFTYYFWEQWYDQWDNIMEFDLGCHYKYNFIRVFAGLDCHMITLKSPGPIKEDVWNFKFMGTTVFPFIFGYEYGVELCYRVGFLTDVFVKYKRYSYFDDLQPKGISIRDNNFGTFVFGVKFIL
ncbi:MAG: CsgG/HfaB family protein [bacterium]